jgi:serine O-acetyltransferase
MTPGQGVVQLRRRVTFVGASIPETWVFERLGDRSDRSGCDLRYVAVDGADETSVLARVLGGPEKPSIALLEGWTAFRAPGAEGCLRTVRAWLEPLRAAGVQPVLVTVGAGAEARGDDWMARARRALRRASGKAGGADELAAVNERLRRLSRRERLPLLDLAVIGDDARALDSAVATLLSRDADPAGAAPPGRSGTGRSRVLDDLRRDLDRYFELDSRDGFPGPLEKLRILVQSAGFQAVLVYRFGSWAKQSVGPPVLRRPLEVVHWLADQLCVAGRGIHIDARARIGGGLYIGHSGGVLIGPTAMGRDCNVGHNVTVGVRAGGAAGVPRFGDRVWIGTGSVVFGNITVGDGVTICPLTVVSRNLAPRSMVVGNPLQVLKKDYDNSAEVYGPRRRGPETAG